MNHDGDKDFELVSEDVLRETGHTSQAEHPRHSGHFVLVSMTLLSDMMSHDHYEVLMLLILNNLTNNLNILITLYLNI